MHHRRTGVPHSAPHRAWIRLPVLAIAVLPLLAACETGARNPSPSVSADSVAAPVSTRPEPTNGGASTNESRDSLWTFSASNAGTAIAVNAHGEEILRIVCRREPPILTVDVHAFTSIGSEEQLSIGLDGEPYIFVAQVTPPPPIGVHAEREPDEEFIERLGRARTVSVVYGAQTSGPHPVPDRETAESFTNACLQTMSE